MNLGPDLYVDMIAHDVNTDTIQAKQSFNTVQTLQELKIGDLKIDLKGLNSNEHYQIYSSKLP